jgi:hypothetical protein
MRYRLKKPKDQKELNSMCDTSVNGINHIRKDLLRSKYRITFLQETNRLLRAAIIHATAPPTKSPNHGTK